MRLRGGWWVWHHLVSFSHLKLIARMVLDSPRKPHLFGVPTLWWLQRDSCKTGILVSTWSPFPCISWSSPSGLSSKIDHLHSNSGLQEKVFQDTKEEWQGFLHHSLSNQYHMCYVLLVSEDWLIFCVERD